MIPPIDFTLNLKKSELMPKIYATEVYGSEVFPDPTMIDYSGVFMAIVEFSELS